MPQKAARPLECPYCQDTLSLLWEENFFTEYISLHWCNCCNEVFVKYHNQEKPFLFFDYQNPLYTIRDLENAFSKKTIDKFVDLCEKTKIWKDNGAIDIVQSARSYMNSRAKEKT